MSKFVFTAAVYLLSVTIASISLSAESAGPERAAACDPDQVLGNQTCVKCHAAEIDVWRNTPHSLTFDQMHRRPEAKQIALKLGLKSIKHAGRCTACHYTPQRDADSGHVHMIAGVSCESCHGEAKEWIDVHHDYGGEGITRETESPTHRAKRVARSIACGMRNPVNVYLVAQSCLRCHTTADEQLVNVGGHSPGSLDFEFVSWSQGTIRHNFVRSDGKVNQASAQPRLRVMFVAGMIAELEATLRATAVATQRATFGVTSAKRAARCGAKLKSVVAKVDDPILDQIVAVFLSVQLKLNNAEQLQTAADEVARLGFEFAAQRSGDTLAELDRFIPPPKNWK